jgi:hypothetical protein
MQPTPSAKIMLHSPGGVIHLDDSDADMEEVGLDVEEVITWDQELRRTKMFSTGFLILSGRKFVSSNLDEQQKILFNFIDQPAHDYFLSRSQQARAFQELKIVCKLGWTANSVTLCKKKWDFHFVAEHLALLLVLQCQVENSSRPLPGFLVLAGDFFCLHRPPMCLGIRERM